MTIYRVLYAAVCIILITLVFIFLATPDSSQILEAIQSPYNSGEVVVRSSSEFPHANTIKFDYRNWYFLKNKSLLSEVYNPYTEYEVKWTDKNTINIVLEYDGDKPDTYNRYEYIVHLDEDYRVEIVN